MSRSIPHRFDGRVAAVTGAASGIGLGIATALVAVVPTYESIGVWGAVILTVLRFVQGVGVGGDVPRHRQARRAFRLRGH